MWETIREYLTFTRKERYGVLFLLVLICILFILPYFFQPHPGDPDPAAYEKLRAGIKKFESGETDSTHMESVNDHDKIAKKNGQGSGKTLQPFHGDMHNFDPNTISKEDWLHFGLSERVSLTISHFIERGGRFRKPEDLKKIYGLDLADYQRILPYLRIADREDPFEKRSPYSEKLKYGVPLLKKRADSVFNRRPMERNAQSTFLYFGKKFQIIDINLSDSSDWVKLPGIGAKLAARIIHFREKLGGFYKVDQVGETFGLPDSTFQKVKPVLRVNSQSIVQLDVNSVSKELLQVHPYIGWQMAKAIVTYRAQHGKFRSVDELLQLAQLDTQRFWKLKPYLMVTHED